MNDTELDRKLARFRAGLAPEDTTYAQACETGRARRDRTYAGRWLAHEGYTVLDLDLV
jgi:hypothetical protein